MNTVTGDENSQFKQIILDKLLKSGEKDRLKEHLRIRLVESGWKEQVKDHCKAAIKQNGTDLSIDELVKIVTPLARSSVDETIKAEVLSKIRQFLKDQE